MKSVLHIDRIARPKVLLPRKLRHIRENIFHYSCQLLSIVHEGFFRRSPAASLCSAFSQEKKRGNIKRKSMAQEIDEVHFRLLLGNFRRIIWRNKFKYGGGKNGESDFERKTVHHERAAKWFRINDAHFSLRFNSPSPTRRNKK